MAVSLEAAFVLIDKASGPLRKIELQAKATDKALNGLGGSSSTSGVSGWTRQFKTYGDAIGTVEKQSKQLTDETKKLGTEVDKTAKKVKDAGNWFDRTGKKIVTWTKALVNANPVLKGFIGGLGGVVGGLKGMIGALPKMVWLALAAAPVVIALAGAIGALAASLTMAVGGGVLLGGGLLGAFAVGLGSIAAIAKPAITATQNYEKAVKNLNTALASGSPTAIRARQQQLDAIAKANPGVAQLAGNLKKFTGEWKKATAPARASFFQIAADGIQTLRGLLPTLANEANKNTASLALSFRKILAPFLDSSTFKGFVSGLGGVFRANLPGFMQGLVNVFTGLANILKVLTPQLDRAGPSFEKFTGKFAKWTTTAGGQSTIHEMGRAFTAWLDLLKQIARILGQLVGAAAGPGTDQVSKWADKLSGFADKLSKPATKGSMGSFFQRSLDDVDKLWPVLKQVATDLDGIYKVWKPLGGIVTTVVKNVPAWVIAIGSLAWVGGKTAFGAVKGAKGVLDFFGKERGSTPLNPVFTKDVGSGPTHGPSSPFDKVKNFIKDAIEGKGGQTAAKFLTKSGGPELLLLSLLLGSTEFLPKGKPTTVPAVRSNPRGKPVAGSEVTAGLPHFTVPKVASNPNRVLLGQQPVIHKLSASHYAPYQTATTVAPASSATSGLMHGRGVMVGASVDTAGIDKSLSHISGALVGFVHGLAQHFNNPLTRALGKAQDDFTTMGSAAGDSLLQIQATATATSDDIRKRLPKNSAETNQAVATNYAIAAGDVQTSMNNQVIAVDVGMKAIAKLMAKAFEALGIKSGAAKQLAGAGYTLGQINHTISSAKSSGLTSSSSGNASSIGGGSYQYASGGRLPGPAIGDHLPLFGRGGKLLGIADGGELVVNRHTEARADKFLAAFGTRLSDMVDGERTPHSRGFARGGRLARFATGGNVPYSGLEGLWDAAGGPGSMAPLMAAIAMAESGGNPGAHNPSGATGLWQILGNPFPGNAYDPATNARMAVAKYKSQGLGAWVTYTSGAYKSYLKGGVPPGAYAGGMAVPTLTPPTIAGSGALGAYGQQVINMITQGANQYLQQYAPGAGGGVPGAAGGPTGVGMYKGVRMANWVIAALQYAASQGVSPQPTSGYRPGFDPHTVGGVSEHAGTQYPHGAVDFGGYHDPTALANKMSVVAATRGFKWPLLAPIGFVDDGHASGTGHALGGRLPWFAGGGDFVANRPQVIGVGDAPGGERVTISPKGQGRIGNEALHVEIHNIQVNRKGDVQKIVDEELRLLAATIERHI